MAEGVVVVVVVVGLLNMLPPVLEEGDVAPLLLLLLVLLLLFPGDNPAADAVAVVTRELPPDANDIGTNERPPVPPAKFLGAAVVVAPLFIVLL